MGDKDEAQTADGAADATDRQTADPATVAAQNEAVAPGSSAGLTDAMGAAQDQIQAEAQATADALANPAVTPDDTYHQGVPGANINLATSPDAPVISTYADALEAGYLGTAAGHANTDKMSVAAVVARDQSVGVPNSGKQGAVVNGNAASTDTAKTKAK